MEGIAVVAIRPEVKCRKRDLSIWTNKCPCNRCQKQNLRMRKLRDHGYYRRVWPRDVYPVLDNMLALGYNGTAAASAIGVMPDTARWWLKSRRNGIDLDIGPGGCYRILNAGQPTDGRVGTVIAQRKLQALARIGWPCSELAETINDAGWWKGNCKRSLQAIRNGETTSITVQLSRAINSVYDRLAMRPAPDDRFHNNMRTKAQHAHWNSPMAWEDINDLRTGPEPDSQRSDRNRDRSRSKTNVDPMVVARLIAGDIKGLEPTKGERDATVTELRRRGKTDREIETTTGIARLWQRYPRVADSNEMENV